MIDAIKNELSRVLELYQKKIDHNFFTTRRSRIKVVKKLREANENNQTEEMIEVLLNFSQSLQGKNPDVGFFGGSKLNSFLWGNDRGRRDGGVYQMLYEFLVHDEQGNKMYQELKIIKKLATENGQTNTNLHSMDEKDFYLSRVMGSNWSGCHSLRRISKGEYDQKWDRQIKVGNKL